MIEILEIIRCITEISVSKLLGIFPSNINHLIYNGFHAIYGVELIVYIRLIGLR